MKVLTIESLRTFLEELEGRYGKEAYSKQEIDEKLKSSGGSVDMKGLAERIPNFRYWLRIKQSPHQTITATCDGKEYTADVLIEKGKTVTLTVKAYAGYLAGVLSRTELTMTEDTEITVTEATKSEELEAGSLELLPGDTTFQIPPKVHVLQVLFGNESKYIKVNPETDVTFFFMVSEGYPDPFDFELVTFTISGSGENIYGDNHNLKSKKNTSTISWSKEINEHAVDFDFTRIY